MVGILRRFRDGSKRKVCYGHKRGLSIPSSFADRQGTVLLVEGPTDVLAFPIEDLTAGHIPHLAPDEPPLSLGDVFLCPSEIHARAQGEGIDSQDLLYLLLAHGILHLLGYDHADDAQALVMERREDELLEMIGRTPA